MIGGLLRILVISLVLLVAAMWLLPRPGDVVPPPAVATVLDAPRPLPAVALTDQTGAPFAFADLRGNYALVFFGFTNCPDICPLTLQVLAQAVDQIRADAPAIAPEVVFVSVDPARDSTEQIAAYVRGFDPDFIGVTAPEATLQPLLDALAVTVHKQTQDGKIVNVVHNGTVYVIDDAGRWAAIFGGDAHQAATIAQDYIRIRRRAPAE